MSLFPRLLSAVFLAASLLSLPARAEDTIKIGEINS